jgi:hypothetical protein
LLNIFIDADACPVKEEVYRVAKRYALNVTLVANMWMRIPREEWLELVVVDDQPDAADDWIVEHVDKQDIVIADDIPLADRCLKKEAMVIAPRGRMFTSDSIGDVLATRDLMAHLRESGVIAGGGPPPMAKKDRSLFLQRLDETIQGIRRKK